ILAISIFILSTPLAIGLGYGNTIKEFTHLSLPIIAFGPLAIVIALAVFIYGSRFLSRHPVIRVLLGLLIFVGVPSVLITASYMIIEADRSGIEAELVNRKEAAIQLAAQEHGLSPAQLIELRALAEKEINTHISYADWFKLMENSDYIIFGTIAGIIVLSLIIGGLMTFKPSKNKNKQLVAGKRGSSSVASQQEKGASSATNKTDLSRENWIKVELFLGVRIAFLAGFAGLYFAYGSAYLDGILLYAFSGIYAALVTISFIAISLQAGASMLRSKLSGVLTKAQLVYTWMIALLVDTAIPFVAYFATSNTLWLYTGYIVSGIVTLEGLLVLIAVTRKPQAQSLESSSEGTKPNSAEISSSPTRGPPQSSTSPALITDVKYDPITAREIWRVVLALLAAAALFKEALTYGVIGLVGIVAGAPLAITTIIGLIGLILAAVLGGRRFYLWISLDSSTTQPRRVALWQQIVLWGAIGLFSAFMTGVLVKLFGSWGLWGALGWEPRNIILPKAAEGLSPQDWAGIVIFFIAAAIFAPIVEEISNRAGYYDGIKRGLGDKKISRTIAVVISSLLFAALHIPSWGFYPDTFLFHLTGGIVLALAYQLSGSLWVAIGTHAILNGMQIVTGLAKIGSIPSVYPTLAITLMAIITFSAIVSYYKNKSKVQITGDKETVSNRVSSSSSKDDSPDLTIKPKKSAFIHYRLAKRLLITVFILAALHLSLEFALIYSAREFPVLAGYPFLPAAVWLLFPLIAGWLYLLLKIRYSKEKYLFYSDRIVHQGGGILSNFETEVKAVNITHASLYLPFVENKLLRTGYVNIDSAGGRNAEITLSSVAEAEKVYQKLIETMQQNGFKLARQKLIQQERPHTFAVFLEVSQAYILRIYALFVFFAPFLFGFAVLISDLGLKELGFIYIALFSAGGLLVLGVVVTSYVVAFLDARRRVYQLYDDTVVFSEGF
ncbi:MAG: CPBP family intramembrane metalloprotease, partial [Candidatus Omnitrophica bacterium]|nr:CPBP family intramembrane metalloprotease [Candidatus Omnitrophota bacterium]